MEIILKDDFKYKTTNFSTTLDTDFKRQIEQKKGTGLLK